MTKNKSIKKLIVSFNDCTRGSLALGDADLLSGMNYHSDYEVFCFNYFLECGDISNVPLSNRKMLSEIHYINSNSIIKEKESMLQKLRSLNKDCPIELFVDKNDSNGFCNLCFFAGEFAGFQNVRLNYYHTVCKTRGIVSYPYIVIDGFAKRWQEIVSNNAAVRCIKNGELTELSLEDAKNMVLSCFTNRYERFFTAYRKFLKLYEKKVTSFSFEYITTLLLDDGLLEKRCDPKALSEYKDLLIEQKIRLKK